MKKTTISYFVVGLLLISSFAAIGMGKEAVVNVKVINSQYNEKTTTLQFSDPTFTEQTIDRTTYVVLNVGGADAYLHYAGQPMLPMYTTKLNFPFGTNIISVKFLPQEVKTMTLPDKILPTPQPIATNIQDTTMQDTAAQYTIDQTIYNSWNLFPGTWVNYYTGGGLDDNNEHATFLTIQTYPARYSPATNTISYVENGVLTITYKEPVQPIIFGSSGSELVIIAPSKFSSDLQKLVNEKISHGITTTLMTTEAIYSGGYNGRDKPEQIKYFIKSAVDNGTKYVLLVGGMDSLITGTRRDDKNQGTKNWLVPVRYTNLYDPGGGTVFDPGFISDLYYADIYDGQGHFSSWDSNHDNIFAKWNGISGKDTIDLYPDVAVGRLPCRNTFEVKIMVNKIINYEKQPADTTWFNKMILVGGDSFDDPGTNYYEGEVTTTYIKQTYMSGYTPVKLYASYNVTDPQHTPTSTNIKREITAGSGYLLFDGHGNPSTWGTHWPGIFNWNNVPSGLNIFNFPGLNNGGKLPVCVVGGCHNSMFNVTLLSTLSDKSNSKDTWCYGLPVPESWSEILTHEIGGGSIATMGNSGLGYGTIGDNNHDGIPDCIQYLGGYQEGMFFKTINEGVNILGDAWKGTISKYLDAFPGMADQIDCKTVEEWPLIGDPTLKIGGYAAGAGLKAQINNAESGVEVDLGKNVMLQGVVSDGQAPYTYVWDIEQSDGTIQHVTGSTLTYSWNVPGVYWVSLKVTDSSGKVNTYDTIVGVGDWLGLGDWLNVNNQNSQSQQQQQSNPQQVNPSPNQQNSQQINSQSSQQSQNSPSSQQNNLLLQNLILRHQTLNR